MEKIKRPFEEIMPAAEALVRELEPHCNRVQIAGSLRRKKPMVGDIEIVLDPKPYQVGLFCSGIAEVIGHWETIKGQLPHCKYTQRIHPDIGIPVDFFFAVPRNWGLILAIRTGSAEYSHKVLAKSWVKNGYYSVDGMLKRASNTSNDEIIPIKTEEELFSRIGIPYTEPENREYHGNS